MSKKMTVAALTVALGVGAFGGTAVADGGSSNDPARSGSVSLLATGGVTAPNARIAAVVQSGGAVVRSKGIAAVTHPSTGLYCIDPAPSTFDVGRAVPVLSVDWSTSLGDALMAQWRSTGVGCPSGWFAVLTFDGEDGSFDLSDGVSFTLLVP
jgi:hypothetical protein